MLAADAISAVIPAALLEPFPEDDRRMISEEAAADPEFGRRIAQTLARPGGPSAVALSARKAVANELNPWLYPESRGRWPVLRRMVASLAKAASDDISRHVERMTLEEKTRALRAIAARGGAGMSDFGQTQTSQMSTLGVVGGVAGAIAGAVATVYTAKVISSAQKQIAQIQSTTAIHQADVQLEIARANAAMAQAQAVINAQQGGTAPPVFETDAYGHPAPAPATAPGQKASPGTAPALPDPLKMALPAAIVGGGALIYMLSGTPEADAFDRLPGPIREHLALEAEDPEFVTGYLIPALRTGDPYDTILSDMAREMARAEMGMGDLGKSFFKKMSHFIRKAHHSVARGMRKIEKKITPKFMQKIRAKVHGAARKVWHQYGGIIIGVVGAILAPFTGGASLIAASILTAAKQMYDAKKAAGEAIKAGKADATVQNAEANKQRAAVAKQVEDFYNHNRAWFLQHDITPDKWAKLTLDQKIDIINAGANGKLPTGATPLPPEQQAALDAQAGIPPAPGAPQPGGPAATYGGGGGGGAPSGGGGGGGGGAPAEGGDEAAYGPPPGAPAAGQPGATYDIIVEGQKVATVSDENAVEQAALDASKPGDRVDILVNGQPTGLHLRTTQGLTDVPPDVEQKLRSMTHDQVVAIVADAERAQGKGGGSVAPIIALLVGGALVLG